MPPKTLAKEMLSWAAHVELRRTNEPAEFALAIEGDLARGLERLERFDRFGERVLETEGARHGQTIARSGPGRFCARPRAGVLGPEVQGVHPARRPDSEWEAAKARATGQPWPAWASPGGFAVNDVYIHHG
jgi:hypothetical protein